MKNLRSMLYVLACSIMVAPSLLGAATKNVTFYNNAVYNVEVELSCGCPITGNYAQITLAVPTKSQKDAQIPNDYPLRLIKAYVVEGEYSVSSNAALQSLAQRSAAMGHSLKIDTATNKVKQIKAFAELKPATTPSNVFMINANRPANDDMSLPVEGLVMYRFIQ